MRHIFSVALTAVVTLSASDVAMSQNYQDVLRFNKNEYEGTARSQSMGSAFGALGADMTSQHINPAGIASYTSSEFAMSLGVNTSASESDYYNFKSNDSRTFVPLNQLGLVFSTYRLGADKTDGIISHSFSVSYSRLADYNRRAVYEDVYGYNSMLDYFCDPSLYDDVHSEKLAYNAGWLSDPYKDDETGDDIPFETNVWEMPYGNGKLDPAARENADGGLVDHKQYVKERGYKGETIFGYGMNISRMVYWGMSVSVKSLSYREDMSHFEQYFGTPFGGAANEFCYSTRLRQYGNGANFKIGVIVVPVKALRVGLSLQSPTFFRIAEHYSASISSAKDFNRLSHSDGDWFHYKYREPGRMSVSLAGVIGQRAIISADYEVCNYKRSRFSEDDDVFEGGSFVGPERYLDVVTDNAQAMLKKSRSLRVGAEFRVINCLSVRAGYNLQTSPLENKDIPFKNDAISGGVGFSRNHIFVDLSYVCRRAETERWVLPDSDSYAYDPIGNCPASLDVRNHNVQLTFGVRF